MKILGLTLSKLADLSLYRLVRIIHASCYLNIPLGKAVG